jgi:hypothetical protein
MTLPDDKYLPRPRSRLWTALRNPLALWVILILVFLAIWQLFRNQTASSVHGPWSGDTASSWTTLTVVLPVAFMAILFVLFRFSFSRVRRFNQEAAGAMKLFSSADYAGAADHFADLLRRYPRPANVRATASFNLAMALLRGGDFDRALANLSALDPGLARSSPALRPTVAAQIAVLFALRGDPAASDRWIVEAEARAKTAGNPRAVEGALTLARAVTAIRRDEHEAAAQDLAAAWDSLEGALVAFEMRPFRALRAFAVNGGDACAASASAPRAASAALMDAHPGELTWLGAEWPQMRTFLEAAAAPKTWSDVPSGV